ncbi:hypothetical protein Efla_004848 [Eimeria flavescens]
MRSTVQKHANQGVKCEPIDEITTLLERVASCEASVDDRKAKPGVEHSDPEVHIGFVDPALPGVTTSSTEQHRGPADDSTPAASNNSHVRRENTQDATSHESSSLKDAAENDRFQQSSTQAILSEYPAVRRKTYAKDAQHRINRSKPETSGEHHQGAGTLEGGGASNSVEGEHGPLQDQSWEHSSFASAPPDNLESRCAAVDHRLWNWRMRGELSRARVALSCGLTRAATRVLPAVQRLWQAEVPADQEDRDSRFKGLKGSLLTWARIPSLESFGVTVWPEVEGVQRDTRKQHAPLKNMESDASLCNSVSMEQADAETISGGHCKRQGFAMPYNETGSRAPMNPPASPYCLPEKAAPAKGDASYFCLLGASAGFEQSHSFQSRPLVIRPLGMSLEDVAGLLGVVSLAGDSLGRKAHWCAVLKAAVEARLTAAQQMPEVPPRQKQLEHVLLLQLLQQQERMVILPSALNSTQQVGVCRARQLWLGAVVEGVGFEAPSAAKFVAVELLKEFLHRCASSGIALWVKGLEPGTTEKYMLDSFKTVANELQQQQPQLSGDQSEVPSHGQIDHGSHGSLSTARAFQGLKRLRQHRQLMRRRQLFLSGRTSTTSGDGAIKSERCNKPCGFDSLTSGAVACQFLWDAEQHTLFVCHTGDVRAVLGHPARDSAKKDNGNHFGVEEREAAQLQHLQHQRSSWTNGEAGTELDSCLLSHSYDCVVLTRNHSTSDREERKRVQGAGVFMAGPPSLSARYESRGFGTQQRQAYERLPEAINGKRWDDGPPFFCPCLLTPPLTATRSLGLCGGQQFGLSATPDIASVTLDPTLGFCFLLVATSSLWKVFSPQEVVDVVVAELWRQQRQHNELQRRQQSLKRLLGAARARPSADYENEASKQKLDHVESSSEDYKEDHRGNGFPRESPEKVTPF